MLVWGNGEMAKRRNGTTAQSRNGKTRQSKSHYFKKEALISVILNAANRICITMLRVSS